ncbi:putative oxidoreductase YceM [compost metagenome]
MRLWREEQQDVLTQSPVPGWQSTLTQRGFVGAIEHFVDCVTNQTAPETSGEQAIYAQTFIEKLLEN